MGGTPTQRYRAGMADLLTGAVDFAPGVSDAMGVADTAQAARAGNYGTAAILGGATMLGMVPIIGDVASKAIRGLDMSQAARMQRAQEQGYDISRPLYHGGASDFDEIIVGRKGFYATENPEIANIYAANAEKRWPGLNNAAPNVMPFYLNGKVLKVSDQGENGGGWYINNLANVLGVNLEEIPSTKIRSQYLRDIAKQKGFSAIEITDMDDLGGRQSQIVVIDPSAARSVNAAFDPAKRDSANLMAGVGGVLAGGSALRALLPQEQERQPD